MQYAIGTRVGTGSCYYYGDYRHHARYPWPKRQLGSSIPDMEKIEGEDRVSVRCVHVPIYYIYIYIYACICVCVKACMMCACTCAQLHK